MTSSSKAKILYIGPISPEVGGKSAGGIATHCWELATQSAKRGYEVYILANTSTSFTRDGVKVICSPRRNKLLKAFYGAKFWLTVNKSELNNLNFLSLKEKVDVLYGAQLLEEIVNRVKPNLIHIHSLHNIQTLSLKLFQNSIPLVITDHGFWQGIHTHRDLEKIRKIAGEANYIISPSNFSKGQMENYKIAPLIKKKVIHHPLDIAKIPLLDRRKIKEELGLKNKKIVLFSGITEPIKIKGLNILLKAVAINSYLRKKCKTIVITNEEGMDYAREFVRQNRIDTLILDPQPWEKIVKYYNAADVFVMPSRSEGFGIVYEEALLGGIPIIGFYRIKNELEHLLDVYIGEGFDANKEDEKDLAKEIIKVLNTNFNRELLREKVIEKLSWDAKFNEFETVYREVLANEL